MTVASTKIGIASPATRLVLSLAVTMGLGATAGGRSASAQNARSASTGTIRGLIARAGTVEAPTSSPLEVVIGINPGTIEGTVQTGTRSAAVGATVVLLPDARSRFDLVKTATAGPSGLFRMDRVAPGSYRLFAWSDVVEDDWLDREAMRAFEQRGAAIGVTDGMTARAVLTTIQ